MVKMVVWNEYQCLLQAVCLSSPERCQVLSEGRGRPSSGKFPHHALLIAWKTALRCVSWWLAYLSQSYFTFVSGLRCHKHNKGQARDDPQVWCWERLQGLCSHGHLKSCVPIEEVVNLNSLPYFCPDFLHRVCVWRPSCDCLKHHGESSLNGTVCPCAPCKQFRAVLHQLRYLITSLSSCAGSEGVVSRLPGL